MNLKELRMNSIAVNRIVVDGVVMLKGKSQLAKGTAPRAGSLMYFWWP